MLSSQERRDKMEREMMQLRQRTENSKQLLVQEMEEPSEDEKISSGVAYHP